MSDPTARTVTRTIVVAEMPDTTGLLERVGERRWTVAIDALRDLISACSAQHGGTVTTADADRHIISFPSVRDALTCAVAIHRGTGTTETAHTARIGVHTGEVICTDREIRGRPLVKAARIAAHARAGEIVASAVVASIADYDDGEQDIWFDEPAEIEIRGFRGRHRLYRVRWVEARPGPLRVVIADDAALLRDGVAALLREHGVDVVATASDAPGLMEAVALHRPDLALIDIRMPPTFTNEGLVAAEHIRATHPHVGVVVLSQHVEPSYAARLMQPGATHSGYLLKDQLSDIDGLLTAMERVAAGGCVVDAGLADRLMETADARGSLADLTEREREVLALVAQGLSNRAIADRLVVTGRTVETHIGQIFSKLRLRADDAEHRRVAAVLAYLRAAPPVSP